MKRLLLCTTVLALIALGVLWHQWATKTAPAIAVSIRDQSSGGSNFLPAVDGYVSGQGSSAHYQDGREIYHATEKYKIVSNPSGRLVVLAHYTIERNGISTEVDQSLPVYQKEPDQEKWSKLDNQLLACAYLNGSNVNY